MMVDPARRFGWAVSWLLFLFVLAAPARAGIGFGDIDITPPPPPRQQEDRTHGYFEYVFLVTNQSSERSYRVSLHLPGDRYIIRGDYLRDVRRTVQVGPGETVRVTLLQPDYPPVGGSGVAVFIDDRRQERELPLTPNETRRNYYGFTGSAGYRTYAPGSMGLLVLANPTIVFPKSTSPGPGGLPGMGGIGMPSPTRPGPALTRPLRPPPGAPPAPPVVLPPGLPPGTEVVPAEPVENWSTDWLTYSRYDGIVLTGDDLKTMPSAVQTALWQYVETGGSLTVLGSAKLPESWIPLGARPGGFTAYAGGFGECLIHPDEKITRWDARGLTTLSETWVRTAAGWQQGRRNTYEANEKFPVVEDLGIPIKGLFVLMLLFTLAIGPANFILLSRLKRRIWLLWTTPVVSFVTCLAVFGYMLISEGWQGHLRTETLTLLDEGSHRATTFGWTGVYSPLTPGDGLHFSYQTEVVSQRLQDGRRAGVRSCTIDWSRDQHFESGWVEARVPAHFKVRKSELRRERVAIRREPDGRLSMVNGLGAEIRRFWYADENGAAYTAKEVAPGARVLLTALDDNIPPQPVETMRQVFLSDNWLMTMQTIPQAPLRRLRPRNYLAELDDSLFLEDALPDARTRKCHALVLGLLKKDDKTK
jgi:hypothetical protein